MLIYQLFPERWVFPQGEIPFMDGFRAVPWRKLREWGFDTVYLLGIWEHKGGIYVEEEEGVDLRGKDERVPSMMAVTNHMQLSEHLGHEVNFLRMIDHLHQLGLKILVDFIPNHTSLDHSWIETHPEYYKRDENGELIREFSGDVAKLDYSCVELRERMKEVVKQMATWHIDGVRCDMAHLIPNDFWEETISELKGSHPNFTFIAEAYPNSIFDYSNIQTLLESKFDVVYEKGFYANIERVVVEGASVSDLAAHLGAMSQVLAGKGLYYFANHDDPVLGRQVKGEERSQLFRRFLPALLGTLLWMTEGDKLIFNGSILGKHNRLAHHWFEKLPLNENELFSSIEHDLEELFLQFTGKKNQIRNRKIWVENELLICEIDMDAGLPVRAVANFSNDSQVVPSDWQDKELLDKENRVILSGKFKLLKDGP